MLPGPRVIGDLGVGGGGYFLYGNLIEKAMCEILILFVVYSVNITIKADKREKYSEKIVK